MRAAIGNGEVLDARVLAGLRDYQRPGEPDFLTHLISVFLDDLSLRLESIRNAQARGDHGTLRSAAHALKGASGELGTRSRLRPPGDGSPEIPPKHIARQGCFLLPNPCADCWYALLLAYPLIALRITGHSQRPMTCHSTRVFARRIP